MNYGASLSFIGPTLKFSFIELADAVNLHKLEFAICMPNCSALTVPCSLHRISGKRTWNRVRWLEKSRQNDSQSLTTRHSLSHNLAILDCKLDLWLFWASWSASVSRCTTCIIPSMDWSAQLEKCVGYSDDLQWLTKPTLNCAIQIARVYIRVYVYAFVFFLWRPS